MQQTETLMEELKSFISAKQQQSDIPGIAVGIVKDGNVIFAEGFGYRSLNAKEKVTSKTIFPIASMTKSFVTAALSILSDQKKIDWDEPVRNVYPEFRLQDQFASEKATLRDLASHRTGLPRHDLLWYSSKSVSKKEITKRLAYLQPSSDFRTTYHYQNMMYTTLGNIIERVANVSWDKFVQKHVLDKLSMTSTSFLQDELLHQGNYARPYAKFKDQVTEIPFYFNDEPEAAGSMESNVLDMTKWLLLHLNYSNMNGEKLITEQEMMNLHSPNIVMSGEHALPFDEMLHPAYCLGWMTRVYRGRRELHHGGNIDGFSSFMSFLPKDRIGVVVLTNLESNFYPQALTYEIYDRLLSLEPVDWVTRFKDRHQDFLKSAEGNKQTIYSKQVVQTNPSHRLEDYIGTYVHKGYGTVTVSLENEQLHIHFNDMLAPLSHFHFDGFLIAVNNLGFEFMFVANFSTNSEGKIHSVSINLEEKPGIDDITFIRQSH